MNENTICPAEPGGEPSMGMFELLQRLRDWYADQGYADKSLADAEGVFSILCDFVGMRSDYTPEAGLAYVEYASAVRGYSKSHMTEIRRAVYVFDCLAGGRPVLERRLDDDPPAAGSSIPMARLRQLVLDWGEDPLRAGPPKVTPYILGHVANHVGLTSRYTPGTGRAFLEHMARGDYSAEYGRALRRKVYLLDSFVSGDPIRIKRPSERPGIPQGRERLLEEYAASCRRGGNKDSTVEHKLRYAGKLLGNLESCGCGDPSGIGPDVVLRACLIEPVTGCYTYYRTFLRYLADEGIADADYSVLVPADRRTLKLPDVYSRDEILGLEASFDRDADLGRRDYAMVLLASRLGLRPSDIVTLRLDEVDFERGVLSIVQQKTGRELVLPLLPELRDALSEYIAVRPRSDSPYVFLRSVAPHLPMCSDSMHRATKAGFEAAGVEAGGRGSGPRALRSSAASHMVDGGESYKLVQDSLGQANRDVVRHYARLDVERLRTCALEPPPVTEGSPFAAFLAGEAW